MNLRVRDVFSHQGRDYVIEGRLTYKLAGTTYRLARAVDGDDVLWVEPTLNDMDDRILIFTEVKGLPVATPPPPTLSYKGQSYVPRLSGQTTMQVEGDVGGRAAGPCEVWRYRAAGDLFLQIEKWPDRTVTLAGESVHKDMVQVLPGS